MKTPTRKSAADASASNYTGLVEGIRELLEAARRASARSVNALMTATYWEIGRRIVEFEQHGRQRAEYGEELLAQLSVDLTQRFGRGFSRQNLQYMRQFYLTFPTSKIRQTLSGKSHSQISQTPSGKSDTYSRNFDLPSLTGAFPLSWSHYVHLIERSRSHEALEFYHNEALRGGWSVRQLDRQIASLFYERTALSKNRASMLTRGARSRSDDRVSAAEEIKDPLCP